MMNIDWETLVKIVAIGAGSGGIAVVVINWVRHSREDAANADKTLAEALKTKEEVKNLKFERDKSIFDLAVKMSERLAIENEYQKNRLDELEDEMFKNRDECQTIKNKLIKALEDLEEEKQKNRDYAIEIEQLRLEIRRLKARKP